MSKIKTALEDPIAQRGPRKADPQSGPAKRTKEADRRKRDRSCRWFAPLLFILLL